MKWGRLLHDVALPVVHRENVMKAWEKTGDQAGRRFSVLVDVALKDGAPEADVKAAQEAATLLLALPWELLHNGRSYLFQGAKPTRVRRRLPGTEVFGVPVVATPIRILLVTARPEDDLCGYIDHRASAQPLVEAMEALPGLVQIHVLSPPTLPALRQELDRARDATQPYHVVHFDGHGVYDKQVGLGGLCFEHPDDTDQFGSGVPALVKRKTNTRIIAGRPFFGFPNSPIFSALPAQCRSHPMDEARQEIRRAIECDAQFGHASEPWKPWSTLAGIETDAGHPAAAAEAKGKAIACYLAYRRDGGENHDGPGRLAFDVTQSLRAGDPAQAATLLQQLAADPDAASLLPFIRVLQAIVAGRRDRTLADAPELHYTMAAEILFLIETLEKTGK